VARLKRVAAVLALAVLIAAVPGAAHAEKTIALSSGTFDFAVDAGGKGEGEVTVGNDGDEPLKALVYVADVEVDVKGEQTFTTPQREGASLMSTPASWFRIYMPADSKSVGNTPYLELEPGERIPIRFEFMPPAGSAPGDHNVVIFFEMFEFQDAASGSGAQISGRLGSRVALRVTGQIAEKVTVRPFTVPPFRIGRDVPFQLTINNAGNINERVQAVVIMFDRDDAQVAESVLATDTAIYADSGQQFTGEVIAPGVAFGPHTLEVRVAYIGEGTQLPTEVTEQRTVWLIPLWAVVLVAFVIIYGAGYLIWRAIRRQRTARKEAAAKRRSHRERDLGADERRRRREERVAQLTAETGDIDAGAPTE
jgi:hypothetical protein